MSVRRFGRSFRRGASGWPSTSNLSSMLTRPPWVSPSSSCARAVSRSEGGSSRGLQVFFQLLAPVDLGVPAALGDELLVGALLDDPAGLEHVDAVALLEGADAVGDDQRRAPGVDLLEPLEDRRLRLRVDGRERVVED